ncbi:glycoside hydrolase family 25 protein [Streptomyces sp. MS06]|uniref:glycoside hydrolase family 25 protein n=1 Tax=Streptomyces sp. MS06 TaxID=3385974 RepID=UPI0039A0E559
MGTSRGIDVSAYQGVQDWAAWKRQGLVFAFAKASEGRHSRDGRFGTHVRGIIGAGLVPGAYHFGWPNQDVGAEAANYISAVRPFAGGHDFVHWLDLERYSDGRNYSGRSAAQIRAWVARWLAIVADAFPGQRVGVYTSATDLAAGHVPDGVPLWYPAYPGRTVDTYAEAEAHAQPTPYGRRPLIWQFTSDPAGPTRVDESIAYLSEAALRAWAGGGTTKENAMALTDDETRRIAAATAEELMRYQLDDPRTAGTHYVPLKSVLWWVGADSAQANATVKALAAQVGALSAVLTRISETGGGLTAAEAEAAAEAGARKVLADIAAATTEG